MATQKTTKVVRGGLEGACKEFTTQIENLGFARTKKMFWTRQHDHTIDFIHFHRGGSSYGTPINYSVDIRVHFGIRAINDAFVAAALNGPYSDATLTRAGRYNLRFNTKTGSTYDRCLTDLVRFVQEQGEPWFKKFQDTKKLIKDSKSPLKDDSKELLKAALDGETNPDNAALSYKLLRIKKTEQTR